MFSYIPTMAMAALSLLAALGQCESILTGTITGYGSASNTPAGSNEVCCGLSGSEHSATYDDPGTCASDNSKYPINTKIYIPGLQKYFVVQDSCADCVNQAVHFDLWMGPESYTDYNSLLSCADSSITDEGAIIVDPNPNYAVDSTPLMDANGRCDSNVDYSRTTPGDNVNGDSASSPSSSLAEARDESSIAVATTMVTSVAGEGLVQSTGIVKGDLKVEPTHTVIGGGQGSTKGDNLDSCTWKGHCQGTKCQTYNDCGDALSCINGACA